MQLRMKLIWPALIALASIFWSCGLHEEIIRQEKFKAKYFKRFGLAHNAVRQSLGIPLLPKDWLSTRALPGTEMGTCEFEKKGMDEDTTARYAMKELFFCMSNDQPIREVDLYYSGQKYIEDDPDYFGWERLEIDYDYVSDSIAHIEHYSDQSSFTHVFKKGRRQAFLVRPHRDSATSNAYEGTREYIHLVRDTISLAQADSVLKSWGIKKSEELDQREISKKRKP